MFATALLFTAGTMAQTNDFYDDATLNALTTSKLMVEGEVANPGTVDFSTLPLRSVIVKETAFDGKDGKFIGAYQYEGYSIYDILNQTVLQKKNEAEFPPIIDLYVEVENAAGEKVVLSWGEIYYPVHQHEIIIATTVRRIVPSKTKDLWPMPVNSKLVVAADLFTERNIENPVKITVKSSTVNYEIDRQIPEMYSKKVDFMLKDELVRSVSAVDSDWTILTYAHVFYGRGSGIHGTTPFSGVLLKEVAEDIFPSSKENLRTGMIITAGLDGYRGIYSYSEVFNRNDQAELLLAPRTGVVKEGAFMLFPSMDFFSDRAIRSLMEVRMIDADDL